MKHLLLLLPLAFVASFAFAQTNFDAYVNTITEKSVETHIYTLASDSMQGRKTADEGQKMAANYIANYFRKNHLDSLDLESYFQPFTLQGYEKNDIDIYYRNKGYNAKKYPKRGFGYGHYFSHEMQLHDTLLFEYVGYGRDVQSENFEDKAILILLDENLGKTYENIKHVAAKTQAKVFIVLFSKMGIWHFNPEKHVLAQQKKAQLVAALPNFSNYSFEEHMGKMNKKVEIFENFMQSEDTIFMAVAFPYEIKYLFNESYKELEKLEKEIAKGKAQRDVQLKNDSLICNINTKKYIVKNYPTENVVAYVEGTDKKDEIIVITAHYDHLGAKKDKIFVGADDNASGTTAVMEMARAFQQAAENGIRPKRSIVFAAVSGEEMGLRGPDYFVRNCPVPIENIVLNVNLDMIGRNNKNQEKYNTTAYFLTNGKHKRKYLRIAKELDKHNPNLELSKHPGFMKKLAWSFSSDHFRFRRRNIPVAVVFTGLHPDYHTPKDTPDKINYPKATQITRLTCQTVWEIANLEKDLKVKVKYPAKQNLIERAMD